MQKADYHMMWLSSSLHFWHAAVVRGSRIHASLIKAVNIELLEQGCGYIPPQLHRDPSHVPNHMIRA